MLIPDSVPESGNYETVLNIIYAYQTNGQMSYVSKCMPNIKPIESAIWYYFFMFYSYMTFEIIEWHAPLPIERVIFISWLWLLTYLELEIDIEMYLVEYESNKLLAIHATFNNL